VAGSPPVRSPVPIAVVMALLLQAAPAGAGSGSALYNRYCLACHGVAGDGGGPAAPWLWPRPRDFTRGEYKWRSTRIADGPTADDLARTILLGAPGTSMPGYAGILTDADVAALTTVVGGFAADQALATRGIAVPAQPAATADTITRGRELFTSLGCVACHGEAGRGDGPAAATLRDGAGRAAPPYDLTATPLRRPRASESAADVRAALWASISHGLAGTAMPGAPASTPAADLWAVVDYVDSIRHRGPASPLLSAAAVAADRADAPPAVSWTGRGAPDEAAVWGGPIPLQGEPPASLAPAQASLSSQQCARCHAKQAREWQGSLHAHASSPGIYAQIIHPTADAPTWGDVESCQRCHAPLAEQLPVLRGTTDKNPAFDAALRDEGITCAACHVRNWTRRGPPRVAPSLIELDSYPLITLELYERSDFCMPCHQLPARIAVAGRPLLDTYREWLDGPYMKRGIQCQHCHMPNREHTWKGVHDPATFRQGFSISASARAGKDGTVAATASLRNVGAGHYLPTTPTPAAWLRVELLDGKGRAIPGTLRSRRIGRDIKYTAKGWQQIEDTRVAPGDAIELAAELPGKAATELEVTVVVHPDDYYERFYADHLAGKLDDDIRTLYEIAARRATASHYEAYRGRFEIDR
jgi:mono/diheme cytochrome c family protein